MERPIGNSVYEAIELVGTSTKSWEDAVKTAMETADKKLTNMRIAEVVKLDTNLADGGVMEYRVRLSFKHEIEPETL
jgi:flavin-binding protein dodecin